MHASSTNGCAFVYFTVQCCIGYSNSLYFNPRMSRSKDKSSGDIVDTAKKHQVKMMEIKMKITKRLEQGTEGIGGPEK